jgi:hypothetical protein
MSKRPALLIIAILAVSSLTMVESAFAQSIMKPSVPEFSLKFVDASYDVPTTHTIDPYTGQDVTHQGYHVNKIILVMAIQNQPLVYQYNGSFLYNIRVKGHYAANWTQLYLNDEIPVANASSTQTLVTLGNLGESGLTISPTHSSVSGEIIPFGGKEDFQVQAMIGGFFKTGLFGHTEFSGEASDWSETQTLTISEGQTLTPSPASTPTPTPPIFEPTSSPTPEPLLTPEQLGIIVGVAIAVAGIGAGLGLLVYFKKRRREAEPT